MNYVLAFSRSNCCFDKRVHELCISIQQK